MKTQPIKKQISRRSLAQLGVIIGQMTHCQPATYQGTEAYLVDRKVFNIWIEQLSKVLKEEV